MNISYLRSFYPQATVLKKIPIVKFQNEERIHIANRQELKDKLIAFKKRSKNQKIDVVTDFDQTISSFFDDNKKPVSASFGIFRESKFVSKELSQKANELFEKYYKFEISKEHPFNFKQQMMNEWLNESMNLILHNQINSEMLQNIINDNVFAFRYGFDDFLKFCHINQLNFLIISGGIQDAIFYMINQLVPIQTYNQLQIIANKVFYDDQGKVIGSYDQVVHSHNKEMLLNRKDYPQLQQNCILMGDMPHDSFMTSFAEYKNQIKIGFVRNENEIPHYKKRYDIVVHNQGSYVAAEYLLRKLLDPEIVIPDSVDNKVKLIAPELIHTIQESEVEERKLKIALS